MGNSCDNCVYLIYDEDYEEYLCDADMDEDDYVRLRENEFKGCPFFRDGDDYRVAKKQM